MYIPPTQTCTHTVTFSPEHTQLSTQEADPVVATEAMSLVLVKADKTVVFVILVNHISCLVGWYAIMGFSLDKGKSINDSIFISKTSFSMIL